MLCRLVPFDVKNCLVVDAILFSNFHECGFAPQKKSPERDVRYNDRVGRNSSWRTFIAPPKISPPTRLEFQLSRSFGVETERARMQSRNSGAKRTIWRSMDSV